MITWKCLLAGLVLGLLAFSHTGQCAAADNGQIVIEDNITYGKADDTELKLDLARPQGEGPFPAIVFIHGGGWYQGNRQGYRGQIQEAAKRGYVAATISYRLMKFDESKKETTTATPIFPAQIQMSYVDTHPAPLVISFVLDVTQQKEAELTLKQALAQEKELGELKSRFVSMASHEFRTPLAAILATTETLTIYRDKMNGQQIDLRLDKIRQQVMHMKDIMEDVLQLARIQAGKIKYEPTLGDLDMLCREIIEELENQAQRTRRISYHGVKSAKLMMFDPRLMRQVITNVIGNALKYSPDEKPVYVEFQQGETEIVLTIRDEGIGIPEDDIKHLFEPFHRAKNVGTISGTGLGMSITKQAVEIHGGQIVPESAVGVGTTITITVPIVNATTTPRKQDAE